MKLEEHESAKLGIWHSIEFEEQELIESEK
jgi:hypothetical protein